MSEWHCRACRHASHTTILSLGDLPLANALVDEQFLHLPEPRFPLTLIRCDSCGLSQLEEEVPREALFRDYLYFSSCSETLVESARTLATRIIAARGLNQASLVLEVASNDGYLLQHYAAAGVRTLGIEPARNIAEVARGRGIPTLAEFFDLDLARQLHQDGCRPDVIHAHNVLAHVSDIGSVIEGFRTLMSPATELYVKVPYFRDLVDKLEFDTIYHEHNFYFTVGSLAQLFGAHGLHILDIDHIALHGGSLRLRIARVDSPYEPTPVVACLLEEERAAGVNTDAYYQQFASKVTKLGTQLRVVVDDCLSRGLTLAGYGAAAKATQLLNFYGLGPDCIRFVCDISPHKQGKYIPGVRIPILPPSALLEKKPDVVLLLAWNFADEILRQQSEFRRLGGRFLIPIPEPRLV